MTSIASKPLNLFQNSWKQSRQQLRGYELRRRPQNSPVAATNQPVVLLLKGDEPIYFVYFAAKVAGYLKTKLLLVNLYSFSYQLRHQFARLVSYREALIKMQVNVPVSLHVEEIDTVEGVLQHINGLNAKLVIYRTKPFQVLENKLFGCPIDVMSENLKTHQLIVPSTFQQADFSNILFTLPSSWVNDDGINMIMELASASHSKLLATHVCFNENIKLEKEKLYRKILKSFRSWNQGVNKYDWKLIVSINNSLRMGLKQMIKRKKADLVVLPKKTQNWLTHFWSIPQYKYIIKQSICPVLVYQSS